MLTLPCRPYTMIFGYLNPQGLLGWLLFFVKGNSGVAAKSPCKRITQRFCRILVKGLVDFMQGLSTKAHVLHAGPDKISILAG